MKTLKYIGLNSLQAILLSLLFHMVTFGFIFSASNNHQSVPDTIEIEIRDSTTYVKDLSPKEIIPKTVPNTHFASKKNRFIKKETVATRSGLLKNRSNSISPPSASSKSPSPQIEARLQKHIQTQKNNSLSLDQQFEQGFSTAPFVAPNIKRAAVTALTTKGSDLAYYTFFLRQQEQYYPRWVNRLERLRPQLSFRQIKKLSREPQRTKVQVVLNKRGDVIDVSVLDGAKDSRLDEAVKAAIKSGGPYPHPPKDLIEADGLIYLYLSFVVYFDSHWHLQK